MERNRLKKCGTIVAIVLMTGLLGETATLAQTRTFDGEGDGTTWSDMLNWSDDNVPDTSTEDAVIDNGGGPWAVQIDNNFTIGDLTLGSDDTLALNVSRSLAVSGGDITNAGILSINGTGSATRLRMQGSGASLDGGGTVQMNGANAIIDDVSGTQTLSILEQTIEGQGNIGNNTIQVQNSSDGTIDANSSGNTLLLDPAATAAPDDFANEGTLQASNGGILEVTGSGNGEFDNTGGLIQATSGGTVEFANGADVTGGTIADNSGTVQVNAGTDAFFRAVTFSGDDIFGRNNSDFNVTGTITNPGTITIESSGAATDLDLQADTTLTGGGTVVLDGPLAGINDTVSGAQTLTLDDQTVAGQGRFGQNAIKVVNTTGSTIDANVASSTLTLDPTGTAASNDFDNEGTLQASNGGILQLTGSAGGEFDNTGGTIQALDGSEVELTASADITGGELTTSGSGEIRANVSQNVFLRDLTQSGTYIAENNTDTGVAGTIENTGTMTIQAGASSTDLDLQADTTLTGGGTVILSGANAGIDDTVSGARVLTIANQTIEGQGDFGKNTITVINQAGNVVDANVTGQPLTLDPISTGAPDDFDNEGTLQASNGGILQLTGSAGGEFDNTGGTIQALDGSEVELQAGADITDGELTTSGNGEIRANAGQNVFLRNLTQSGTYIAENNTDTGVTGTIENTGTMTIQAGGASTDLEAQPGGATLTGGGTVVLSGANAGINDLSGTQVLTVADQTIEGQGSFGKNTIQVVNQADGLIDANVDAASLTLDPASTGDPDDFDNEGTLQASNGGTLLLTGSGGGEFDNTGGTIQALDDSLVENTGSADLVNNSGGTLTGGTYRAVETGNGATVALPGSAVTTIANSNTTVTLDGQFANVTFGGTTLENSLTTLEGTLRVLGDKNFDAANSITSSGVVEVSSGSSITTPDNTFEQTAAGTLFGEGTMANTSDLAGDVSPGDGGMQGVGDAGTLTFDGDLQLSSDANLQFDLGALGDAQDLLDVIGTGDLTLDGELLVEDLGGFEQGTYDLIEFDGTLTDNTLEIASLPSGFTGSILTPNDGAPAGTVQLEAVPEPTSLALLGFGGGLTLLGGRRRRRCAAGSAC